MPSSMGEIDARRDLIMERKVMGKPVIPDMNRDADENIFYRLKGDRAGGYENSSIWMQLRSIFNDLEF